MLALLEMTMLQCPLCALFIARLAAPLALVLTFAPLAAFASSPPPGGFSQEPTADDLAMVRKQIAEARSALAKLAALEVPKKDRHELDQRLKRAEEALTRYERLSERGKSRQRTQGVLFAAGAVFVADDASIVGAIDDALLPILAVGGLATLILTHGPPSVPELATAWQEVAVAMVAVGQEAARIKKEAARPRVIPARSQCQKHYERCQETYLGKRNSGYWGSSICKACWDQCNNKKYWPDTTGDGKPCTWWTEDWWSTAPSGGEPQRRTP
jgi:hypothetical protein